MIQIPTIKGIIRRRLLLNYRVEPEVVREILPGNFRPKVVRGKAVAGVCLIRLEEVRAKGLPSWMGISSENSAHRIAVEWGGSGSGAGSLGHEGVFVPRRDTDSRLNSLAGGRVFPGVHHHSEFEVEDEGGLVKLRVRAKDFEGPLVEVEAEETDAFPKDSVFGSLAESSAFFEAGCTGYSSRPGSAVLDGLLLKVSGWEVSSLAVKRLASAFFDDRAVFPEGSIEFDHALLMRDIAHEWRAEPEMRAV